MITYETIDGRKASVAYVNDDMEPVSRDDATMIKIIFDDNGEVRFGVKAAKDRLKSQFASEKRRAQALLKGDFIKDPVTGEFMGSHPGPGHGEGGGGGESGGKGGKEGGDKKPAGKKPAAVPGYKEGVLTRGTEVEAHRDRWVAELPIKTIEDIKRDAPRAQHVVNTVGASLEKEHGVTFKGTTAKTQKVDKATGKVVENPKGVARILQKIADKEKATGKKVPLARVTDTARATVVLNHPDDADKVINSFGKTHEVIAENWRTIPDSWYTDRTTLLRDRETGVIAEVQLAHPELLHAKDFQGGHELYEVVRDLPAGHPDRPGLNAKMQKLYGDVLDKLPPEWKQIDGRRRRL